MANHHNLVHVVSIVHNISNQVFDVNANIRSLFYLSNKQTKKIHTHAHIYIKYNLTLMLLRSQTQKMSHFFHMKLLINVLM